MSLADKTIGFIGAGAMAEAILAGLLSSDLTKPEKVFISDVDFTRRDYVKTRFSVNVAQNNTDLVKRSDIVVLAVKPFILQDVLTEIAGSVQTDQLMVSIAAGLSTGYISSFFKSRVPVIRVMPNTPSLVGEGASALAAGEFAGEEHLALALELFNSVGRAYAVSEQAMDAVTGLSGSGPAYMYLIIEAMADAGVKAGLPRKIALELSAQTMLGAAKMVLETGEHPAVLKDKVTTPGGTTIAGLHTLEQGKLRATIIDAVIAATQKSKELGAVTK